MANYCPTSNTFEYRLSISFVLCVDYALLQSFEKQTIYNKLTTFTNETISRISLYQVNVLSKANVYDGIRSPPGLTCNTKTKLKDGFADPGGWDTIFVGYQTAANVQFTCAEEERVKDLITRINTEVSGNRLHDHVGYHVIGWVLNLWHCQTSVPTTEPKMLVIRCFFSYTNTIYAIHAI